MCVSLSYIYANDNRIVRTKCSCRPNRPRRLAAADYSHNYRSARLRVRAVRTTYSQSIRQSAPHQRVCSFVCSDAARLYFRSHNDAPNAEQKTTTPWRPYVNHLRWPEVCVRCSKYGNENARIIYEFAYVAPPTDVKRSIELLEKLQMSGEIPATKLIALQKVLQSDFMNAVREVYEHVYETVDVQGSQDVRASATAKATVAAFAASEGHAHPRVVELPKTDEGRSCCFHVHCRRRVVVVLVKYLRRLRRLRQWVF